MKKILTIAIAFVMVFALASTALAAGWDIVVKEKEVEDIKISIDALSGEKEEVNNKYFNPNGDKLFVVLEKTYPVVLDDYVLAVVTVEFPEQDKVSEDMQDYIANGQLKLTIANSGCEFVSVESNYVAPSIVDDEIVKYFKDNAYGKTFYFVVKAQVDKAKVDAKITATLGVYNEWKDGKFSWEVDGEDYDVWHNKGEKIFTVVADDGKVTFPVVGEAVKADENSKIDAKRAIYVTVDGVQYHVVKQVNNLLSFAIDGDVKNQIQSGATYKKVAAVLEEVLDVLGFTYEGVKYMSEEHFVKYFGTIMETEVSKVWPSGYVVELDTVDPSVVPPQTGDNTSVVGFAMIVVALVAAVVLKKVRA